MSNLSLDMKSPKYGKQSILLCVVILYINAILLASYFYDEDLSSFGFLQLFFGCNYLFVLPSLVNFPYKTAAWHIFPLIATLKKQIHDAFSVDHTTIGKSCKTKKKQKLELVTQLEKKEECSFTEIKETPEIQNWDISINEFSVDFQNNPKPFQTALQKSSTKQENLSCRPFPVQETGKPGRQTVHHCQNIIGFRETNTCSTQTNCLATHCQTQRKGESFKPRNRKQTCFLQYKSACFPQPSPCLEEKTSDKTNIFYNCDVNNPLLQTESTLKQSNAKSQGFKCWPLSFIGNLYTILTSLVVKFLCKSSSSSTTAQVVGQLQESVEKSNGGGNSPGQSSSTRSDPTPHLASYSVDILPGDPKKEVYRLSTFENFPEFVPIYSFAKYANAGFYYTGVSDILTCFSCENQLKDLTVDIDPYLLKYHRSNCVFTRNPNDGDNVPIHSFTSSTRAQSSSFRARPAGELLMRRQPTYQSASIMSPSAFNISNSQQSLHSNAASFNMNAGSNSHQYTSNSQSSFGGTSSLTPPSLVRPSLVPPSITPPSIVPPAYDTPFMRQLANIIDPNHEQFLRSLDLCRETDRLQTFSNWPTSNAPVIEQMAKSGWFYLGNLDRTQCFSCGGVLRNWRRSDNPQTEHRSHFPHCPMVRATETRNIPILSNATVPQQVPESQLTESEKHDLRVMFPCEYPASPDMTQMPQRLSTFGVWPYTRATPKMFAEAGLFALGVRDRVKCHYCGGGLQNFRRNDDPIEEHAKWYPTCEFVLQQKGPAFIHAIVAKFPDLNRPILRQRGQDVGPPQASHQPTSSSNPVTIVPPKSKPKSLIEQTMESVIVKTVIDMGFDFSQVKEIIQARINEQGCAYDTAAELLDAVFESSNAEEETSSSPSLPPPPTYTSLFSGPADIAGEEEDIYGSRDMDVEESVSNGLWPLMPSGNTSIRDSVMLSTQPNVTPFQSIDVADVGMTSNQQENGLETSEAPASFSELETSSNSATEVTSHRSLTPRDNSPANVPESNDLDLHANLSERLHELKRERTCKVCLDRQADVLFIPCGHICCCLDCTRALRQCPVCRVKIQKAVRTYSRK